MLDDFYVPAQKYQNKYAVDIAICEDQIWNNWNIAFPQFWWLWCLYTRSHNEYNVASNHWCHACYPLFRCRSKKTSKLCIIGLCEGNSPMNAENVSISWHYHVGRFLHLCSNQEFEFFNKFPCFKVLFLASKAKIFQTFSWTWLLFIVVFPPNKFQFNIFSSSSTGTVVAGGSMLLMAQMM